jgi:hypothetical protein
VTATVTAQKAMATANPWDGYNLSPSTRTLTPTGVLRTYGGVSTQDGVTTLSGAQSAVVLDFGKEVAGLVSVRFAAASDAAQQLGLAFSESTTFVSRTGSDFSNGGAAGNQPDGILTTPVTPGATYTMPVDKLRGGFRYLTLVLTTGGSVSFDSVSLHFTAAPAMSDPSAYRNYFYSSDDLLNRIWYAGAYTVQLNTISPDQGRVWPPPASGWENNATIGAGGSILVDGAKRDRAVWTGDLGIASTTAYVSTGDTFSTRNSLDAIFSQQAPSGELPMAGSPISVGNTSASWPLHSDTYHLWTLVGAAGYFAETGDRGWLKARWNAIVAALRYSTAKIDPTGLMSVTAFDDWARGGQGGENLEANALLYRVLRLHSALASQLGDSWDAGQWTAAANGIAGAVNQYLWDGAVGLYRDNPNSSLYPQDGNSLAVWFGLTDTAPKSDEVVQHLISRWQRYGAGTPEWGANVATFPGSMEVQAQFAGNDDVDALDLIRREWGYMLGNPTSTNSTFWEGFLANGAFGYGGGGSYMSHAHGWSTGPTSALTQYVLGLTPDSAAPGTVHIRPHPGDLAHVEGRVDDVSVSWSHDLNARTFSLSFALPLGYTGDVYVPTFGGSTSVLLDGRPVSGPNSGGYVHLPAVGSGSHTVTAGSSANGLGLRFGYVGCATENGWCSFTGPRSVSFGADNRYAYRTATGGSPCSSDTLGDPAFGVAKSCSVNPPLWYVYCAGEGQVCPNPDNRSVVYGADGVFTGGLVGTATCDNSTFGDPVPGIVKSCFLSP